MLLVKMMYSSTLTALDFKFLIKHLGSSASLQVLYTFMPVSGGTFFLWSKYLFVKLFQIHGKVATRGKGTQLFGNAFS